MKEVAVTPSFLSLPEATRRCQLNETLHGCQTRKYLELLSLSCHCLPAHLKTELEAGVSSQIIRQLARSELFDFTGNHPNTMITIVT